MKYKLVDQLRKRYPVMVLCSYLECSRSGYYDWIRRGRPDHNGWDSQKAAAILAVYMQKRSRGRRQVKMQLETQFGIIMCLGSIHRYMKLMNIKSVRKNKYNSQKKEAPDSSYTFPNVLQQDFSTSNRQVWLTDVTYLPCRDGMLYLSCIKDLCGKDIVAHSMSVKNDINLVKKTFEKAEDRMKPGLIVHSDQGAPYCSKYYHELMQREGMVGSMSDKGNPYDNAPIESFFSTLKNEELVLYKKMTRSQMRKVINNFIKYYNQERPQWELGKMTPSEYRVKMKVG